ncbi:MAG: NAD(P)-binding domain-containing protein [Anaerolineaceae bacterium]|nr:NAD(P)-binding domain-containing protein [Anaerolineaceae bacterium]
MNNFYDTIIIGGGQAGLSSSYYLKKQNQDHIVLEKADASANVWRTDRWDSFTLLTPNWTFQLPGAEYSDQNPNGFMPREEIISRFDHYIKQYQLPVQYQTQANAVELSTEVGRYSVNTDHSVLYANNVIIATGLFQKPKIPTFQHSISKDILQLHSGHYRNPQSLPPGAVLVVGSGQSGCQIVDELLENDRKVYQSIGSAGRAPRRYRGKDVFEWLNLAGFFDQPVSKLPSPKAKFNANPQVSGRNGGKALNLHQFAHDGVVLLGHLKHADDQQIFLATDLKENLAKADKFEKELVKMIDQHIETSGLDAPIEELPELMDGFDMPEITELDLKAAGIKTIIWAGGYSFDFSLVHLPVFDSDGYPIQERGVTAYSGLYFLGLPWLYKQKSGLLLGVGEDAEYIVSIISGVNHVPDNHPF